VLLGWNLKSSWEGNLVDIEIKSLM
jgi:hypothetical protein